MTLGIGANTAIFSVVNAVLLRPLPYPDPTRLVVIWEKRTQEGTRTNAIAPADYLYFRTRNHSFRALDAEDQTLVNRTGDGKAERLVATVVTSGFFPTYEIPPLLGRAFTAQDESGDGHTAMLSYAFWQSHFGGDARVAWAGPSASMTSRIRLSESCPLASISSSDVPPISSCRWS